MIAAFRRGLALVALAALGGACGASGQVAQAPGEFSPIQPLTPTPDAEFRSLGRQAKRVRASIEDAIDTAWVTAVQGSASVDQPCRSHQALEERPLVTRDIRVASQ